MVFKNITEQLEHILLSIFDRRPTTQEEFDRAKNKACSEHRISQPENRVLFKAYQNLIEKKRVKKSDLMEQFLQKAGVRSGSGIAIITSLTKPFPCPGKCIYCPTEVRMPKRYIASEPAAARSLRLNFDPYILMQQRIKMLEANGHPTDKIEYIIKGGTWNAYTLPYQYWFILESFRACNDLTRRPSKRTRKAYDITKIKQQDDWSKNEWGTKTLKTLQKELAEEQEYNDKRATYKIIGLTLETRPDAVSPKSIFYMRQQGCTLVELGLQAADDAILSLINRGHTVEQCRQAIYLLRSAGFKVDLHMMPDLPGTTPEHDVAIYRSLFEDTGLCPDMVKIYPCTVIPSAELYQWYKDGSYAPYGGEGLFRALLDMKRATPRYCRISRIIRDIPATEIAAGNAITNLREALEQTLRKKGEHCVCLRCREIGRQKKYIPADTKPVLFVDQYKTRGGTEYFISFEDPNRIAVFGFLRLRIPDDSMNEKKQKKRLFELLPEIRSAAFIRELHVYGQMMRVGQRKKNATQHRGLGTKLVKKAEKIVALQGIATVTIISGVGVRTYYRKLGYRKSGTYMVKCIQKTLVF